MSSVLAPPGVYVWGAPRTGGAGVVFPDAIAPAAYNVGRLRSNYYGTCPLPLQGPLRGSRGVDSSSASAEEVCAEGPPPASYNIGRLRSGVQHTSPIGLPPSAEKSEAALEEAATKGVNVAAMAAPSLVTDPGLVLSKVKALMDGELNSDEADLLSEYSGRLKIYAAVARRRPLTAVEQAAVDEIDRDITARVEGLATEDARAVAAMYGNINALEGEISAQEAKEGAALTTLAAKASLEEAFQRRLQIEIPEKEAQIDLEEKKSIQSIEENHNRTRAISDQHIAAASAEIERAKIEIGDSSKALADIEELMEAAGPDPVAFAHLSAEAADTENFIQEEKTRVHALTEDVKRMRESFLKVHQSHQIAVRKAVADAETEHKHLAESVQAEAEALTSRLAAAAQTVQEGRSETLRGMRTEVKEFYPNKRFGSRDAELNRMNKYIASLVENFRPPATALPVVPEEAKEVAIHMAEEPESGLEAYYVPDEEGLTEMDRFELRNTSSAKRASNYVKTDDLTYKFRTAYPGIPRAPWEGLNRGDVIAVFTGKTYGDPDLQARALQVPNSFRVRILKAYGWNP